MGDDPAAILRGVYFICVILIGGLSFYAGTLRPKKTIGMPSQITSVPRN